MPEDRKKDMTEDEDEDLVGIDQVVQLWVLHSFLGAVKANANLRGWVAQFVVFLSQKEKKNFSDEEGDAQKEEYMQVPCIYLKFVFRTWGSKVVVGDRGLCCLNRESNCHEASTDENRTCKTSVCRRRCVGGTGQFNNENDKHPLVAIDYIFKSAFPLWFPSSLIFQRQWR